MPRRYVMKVKEIYRLRGVYWARHYRFRQFSISCGVDGICVINALVKAGMPDTEVQIDGSIYAPLDVIHAGHRALEVLGMRNSFADDSEISITWLDLMCPYFWTETGWMQYVRLYEALADPVEEDYYMIYDAERDGGRFVPMSSKPSRNVPRPVDKSVDKSGTSQVQVGGFRYKSRVLAQVSEDRG